ncbi:RsmD family RNA methyltransferase [Gemmatimonadota bacterium]
MRIVAGAWAGRDLVSPGGRVRPTAEDLRDAWMTWLKEELKDARVLDLFAGTGALGLEALSRGAAKADFVENGSSALHALKSNVTRLRARDRTRIFKKDVFTFLAGLSADSYDLVLADPPYTSTLADRLVALWMERPFGRVLSIEHSADRTLPGKGSRRVRSESAVTTYRVRKPGKNRSGGRPKPPRNPE